MDGCKKQIVMIGGGGINPAVIAHAITKLEDNGFNVVPYEADVTKTCFAGRHFGVSAYDLSESFNESLVDFAHKRNRDELYITKRIRRLSKPKKHQRMINL